MFYISSESIQTSLGLSEAGAVEGFLDTCIGHGLFVVFVLAVGCSGVERVVASSARGFPPVGVPKVEAEASSSLEELGLLLLAKLPAMRSWELNLLRILVLATFVSGLSVNGGGCITFILEAAFPRAAAVSISSAVDGRFGLVGTETGFVDVDNN